ncbi:MAG: GvpL/GvpF family gas vesicle protein, partial [bacterium]|nr:GvpL/GvpF family gas vesicle protein [bacterium]
MKKQGIYAYAIVSSSQSRLDSPPAPISERGESSARRVKMENISPVNYQDLTLIGKMINISIFQKELQEALKDPKAMEAVLTEHQDFLDRLMKETTVVPFQFGTILKDKEGA